MPLPRSVREHLLQNEREKLAANTSIFDREGASLTRQIKQSDEQAALVAEQIEKTRQGVRMALSELERVQDLFQRGLTPANRLAEERRLTLLQQTQSLQATERLGQVTRDREELARRLDALRDQRKTTLTQELHDSTMQLEAARIRLVAAEEKLTYAGVLRSQLTRGKGASPDLIIHRTTGGADEQITADEGTQLQPGDTVDVTLRSTRSEVLERRTARNAARRRRQSGRAGKVGNSTNMPCRPLWTSDVLTRSFNCAANPCLTPEAFDG